MGPGMKEVHWRFRLENTKDLVFRNHIGNHVGCVMSKSPVVQTGVKGELSSSPQRSMSTGEPFDCGHCSEMKSLSDNQARDRMLTDRRSCGCWKTCRHDSLEQQHTKGESWHSTPIEWKILTSFHPCVQVWQRMSARS